MKSVALSILTFLLLLTACKENTNTYTLSGTAQGFENDTEVYVYGIMESRQPSIIDTLTVSNGTFEGEFDKLDQAAVHYLQFQNTKGSVVFFPENEDLKATIYKDSISASYVEGSKQNDAFRDFTNAMRDFNEKKQLNIEKYRQAQKEQDNATIATIRNENMAILEEEKAYKRDFIENNKNSLFSVMLLSEMLGRKEISTEEAGEIIETLSPKVSASPLTDNLRTSLANLKKADVGSTAPNFSAPTPDGETLALNDVLGKYTIIDFWASWCKPCRRENPNVVRVYEKYHDKGLNIISVSLDRPGQKERWLQAIEDDNMDWYHVSNLQFWQDPIAQQYSVRSIPATFLLDESGTIIDKNLRGQALENKMASLLGSE
ncbi:TlpA disulfide reductase family protein [Luteirhabdus pelagi]|uniref:TlpA disulfide reductase family protein n=1 Tax=Luteirhabdus pelagi TaxID=2792783 RepID=UPI00193A1987|nr:TlpA disulfide reductase family protein [Luteirhabdus pelagi]